jgi:hypothetical protein
MKWEYISLTWQSEWVTDAKASVIQLWKRYRPSTSDSTTIKTAISASNSNAFITWKH